MRHLLLIAVMLAAIPAAARDNPVGYLPEQQVKALLRQIPEPPEPGSAADKADRQRYRESASGIGNAAWQRATGQLTVNATSYRRQMSCALGVTVGPKGTPAAAAVLARAAVDAKLIGGLAKDYFQRSRPFTIEGGRTCDPNSAKNKGVQLGYAYPSGHATTGLLWGLILADMLPQRRAAAVAFGKETGDLRVACRVHWQSDVVAGQQLAGTLYKLIAARPAYQADLAKARAELTTSPPLAGC
ncbi:phosphatase PAP2 family protein [Sandarakinorhabdus sp.]|uniref:phosphatase PAP2 family protein n=1 Tax=Sandarakinorhabdus sp. TaxID=1916663 RepID=UPI003F7268AE